MNFTQTTVKKIFIEVIIPADKQVKMTYYKRQSWIEVLRESSTVT